MKYKVMAFSTECSINFSRRLEEYLNDGYELKNSSLNSNNGFNRSLVVTYQALLIKEIK